VPTEILSHIRENKSLEISLTYSASPTLCKEAWNEQGVAVSETFLGPVLCSG